ncbi:hypothetical protein ACFLIN_09270 [Corynebacterium kutscheri]|uniref:hypothetical protein n=1 Tax=Corynebacterium kutscheri TaxID=35755 RepID=UPI0037C0CB4A
MRTVFLRCGQPDFSCFSDEEVYDLSAIPRRGELKVLDRIATEILPVDPTPSLAEIAASAHVDHLGTPQRAPQQPDTTLRCIVIGTDAALSAVITRLMRSDQMWVHIGYIPTKKSVAATNWGIDLSSAATRARQADVDPVPLIRDDTGVAIAGSAYISDWQDREITAEIIVDDYILLRHQSRKRTPTTGIFGARLVPMLDAPGLVAATLITGENPKKRLFHTTPALLSDPQTIATGRALQAGGEELKITIDGVPRKRPVERVTFYRHLRDLQIVR